MTMTQWMTLALSSDGILLQLSISLLSLLLPFMYKSFEFLYTSMTLRLLDASINLSFACNDLFKHVLFQKIFLFKSDSLGSMRRNLLFLLFFFSFLDSMSFGIVFDFTVKSVFVLYADSGFRKSIFVLNFCKALIFHYLRLAYEPRFA